MADFEHETCVCLGMPTSYQPYVPEQEFLLPPSLSEWLPPGHLAHYISDTIDALDLSALFKRYEGGGSRNQPFHPTMMVKVLVYGYATGVFSSRKIARKLHEDVAFRVLAAGYFPKHRTLCDFRALHLSELAALFVQVVELAGECGQRTGSSSWCKRMPRLLAMLDHDGPMITSTTSVRASSSSSTRTNSCPRGIEAVSRKTRRLPNCRASASATRPALASESSRR